MANTYLEYSRFEEGGVGSIPKHWSKTPLKGICRVISGYPFPSKLFSLTEGYPLIRIRDLNKSKSAILFNGPFIEEVGVYKGDVLVGMDGDFNVGTWYGESPGLLNQRMCLVKAPTLTTNRFLFYYLPIQLNVLNELAYSTTVKHLSSIEVKRIKVPLPPPDEQTAIVKYLDHMTHRIDKAIRAKKKLIQLLNEQKQVIIHQAVTKGLDPNVPMKDSGVPWLGEVPEHWEVVKLGRHVELKTGFAFKSGGFTQDANDIKLLRGVNISPGKIRWVDVVRWKQSDRENFTAFELQVGDIVLGMDRPIIQGGIRVATVSESDIPALLLQRVALIRPKKELLGELLRFFLEGKSFADYLTPIFTGISVPHLSPDQIKSFCIALPPYNEQNNIVRWITEETAKIDALIFGTDHVVDLLQEYRTRLIVDVVTGQIDVREIAAQLPDEQEDVEPFELNDVEEEEELITQEE